MHLLKRHAKLLLYMTFKEFQRKFWNIYKFTLLLFQALFKRGINNKTKIDESSLLHIFYYILQYTIIYTQFNKTIWGNGDSNPKEKSRTSNTKTEQWLMYSGRPRVVLNTHFFVSCQIDLENKQHFSLFSGNNPLSKIKFHSLIPLKRNSPFMRYLFVGYQSGKWFEKFLYWH